MRSSRLSWRSSAIVLASFAILTAGSLAGCATGATTAPSAAAPAVTDAWIRMPAAAGQAAAAYFTITNPGGVADALLSVSSPMADACQLHQTMMDSSGMTGMQMVDRIDVPAGGMMKLEPGGYHLMMTGVKALTLGSKVELDLTFQRAGTLKVMAEVKAG